MTGGCGPCTPRQSNTSMVGQRKTESIALRPPLCVPSRRLRTLVVVGLAGCSGGDQSPLDFRSITDRENTAAAIVESTAPRWQTEPSWKIAPVPAAIIGAPSGAPMEDQDEVLLERVQGTRFLSDGRIVVADAGPRRVMVFDTVGALVARFGGRGEGPGELGSIAALHICGGDSIAVVDGRRTVHLFDRNGTFARRARFRLGERSASLHGVSIGCARALLQQRTQQPPLDRIGLTDDVFVWVDVASEAIDTVTTAGLLEAWTRSLRGVVRPWVVPWGTSSRTFATRGDELVLGNGRVPELRRYDSAGGLRSIIRWSPNARPVTMTDRRRYTEQRARFLAWAPPDEEETRLLFPALGEYPEIPTHKPIFDELLLDDHGVIWARVFPEESLGLFDSRIRPPPVFTETWTVFDSAEGWLGDLRMPDRFELQAIDHNRLLGVSRDSLDVETVQVLRIEKVSRHDRN